MWSNRKNPRCRKIRLSNHLLNQWYNLCSQDNGDAPNIRFDKNNKLLIQVDNASFYCSVSTVSYHRKVL